MTMTTVSGGHVGAWGGPAGLGGGGLDGKDGHTKSSYVGIASLNTSVRDKKNLLEIRLERTGLMSTSTSTKLNWIIY